MKSLDEIEQLYAETLTKTGLDRYESFHILSKKCDDFAEMCRYIKDKDHIRKVIDMLDYGMLCHNAVGAYCTARGWTKIKQFALASEDKVYISKGRKEGDRIYNLKHIQEVIDRNDATAVQNFRGMIDGFYLLLKINN